MSATHGLASTYRNGRYKCRCAECCRANTERRRWEKQKRAERLATDPSLAPHGVAETYNNWGCRCAPCSAANAQKCREWKARQKGRTT